MASTSFSKKPRYDVFINHCGIDVKDTLASSIYHMLTLFRVQAFLDRPELKVGDPFPDAIQEAINSASVHIAIFSPGYADSRWCLDELVLILQTKVTIIPVFYHVQPADVRYATKRIYADAFRKHQQRYEPERIKEWEEALSRVSDLSGCILAGDKCDEGKLLRDIVDAALHKMKKVPLHVATFPVRLEEIVQDFESEVGFSIGSKNVHIVGIVGMGGSGKTTLAIEVYNRKCFSIRRSSFLSNVRDAASTNTLHNLQNILLDELGIKHPTIHNIHQGIGMLTSYLRSMAVLIVYDNVDHEDQIRALLPSNLGEGSLIIVTSREKKVLKNCCISSIYSMKPLDPFNSKLLFRGHAFQHSQPIPNFDNLEDLINRFVEACNGLPLALKVLGAMLNGESKAYWEDQLQKISKILPKDIADSLKLSYDSLDPEVRQMFLDVACFFIGEKKSLVLAIWYGSGWKGELGWETLVNKCLVGLDQYGCIEMHDHLRDLGRQIALKNSPSRIWEEEHFNVREERDVIRGIVTATARPSDRRTSFLHMETYYPLPSEYFMQSIKIPSLRALQLVALTGKDFRKEFVESSRGLIWLRLWDFNGTILPPWLSLAKIRVLELYNAQNLEELWQDNVQLPLQLREMIIDITGTTCFRGLPRSIGDLKYLTKIVLNGNGSSMKTLPEEFCHLRSLEILQMSLFPMLSSLPDHFGELQNLQVLIFSGVQLTALPASFKKLRLLEFLEISDSQSFFFTSEMLDVLEIMAKLHTLRISDCPQVVELPHLTTQVSLRELNLSYTGLRELPNNMEKLTKLETLLIASDNLIRLPESLGKLSCLTSLAIYDCDLLQFLPKTFGHLSNLRSLKIEDTPIQELSSWVLMGSRSRCNLGSLKSLYLFNTRVCTISITDYCCASLETLHLSCNAQLRLVDMLPKTMRKIIVHGCEKLLNMRGIQRLQNLENLEITDCPKLAVLPIPGCMFSVGRRITIKDCPKCIRAESPGST